MATINSSVNGNIVTLTIYTDPLTDETNWGVYIQSHTDRGLGQVGRDPYYPYYVEEFHGSGFLTQTITTSGIPDDYVAVLAQGGVEKDYTQYTIGTQCVPNWQCEQPFNTYEYDGCGNRRVKASEPYCCPEGQTLDWSDLNNPICVPLTVIKYKCVNNVCTSDNGDGSGTFTENTCGGTCTAAQTHKECINNICTQVNTPGTDKCTIIGQSCTSTTSCDETKNFEIFGQCIPKTYVYVGFGILALMMLKK